jgi:transcriptional regulator with XRE-family HTH domain
VQPPTHQPLDSTGPAASARQDSASSTNPSQQPHLHSSSGQQPFPLLLMQARLSRGWTQQQLADQLGTTPQTVSRWERGIATPGPYHRGKLSALFGLSLAEVSFFEARREDERETASAHETGPAAEEGHARHDQASSSYLPGVEPASAPAPAALAPSAPVEPPKPGGTTDTQALSDQRRRPAVPHRHPTLLWRIIASVLVLAALLLLTWPAALALLAQVVPTPRSKSASGTIALLSSDAFAGNSAAGMNDEVAIHLVGVPLPPAGTSYFAWMTGSSGSEAVWTPLGRLTWTPAPLSGSGAPSPVGSASLFSVSPQHSNLLVTYSRFLITEEATSSAPVQPSSAWVYQASISTTPTPGDPNHYSLLDHLRHLLAADPQLAAVGINGGLVYWLARNSEQVAKIASGLQADWQRHQFGELRQRLIGILLYLDGSPNVQADLPSGTARPSPSPFTRVGLLTVSPAQEPPGYVLHTDIHLEGVRDALGATAAQRQEALHLRIAMNAVGDWLTNVREDALQLIHMDDTHLAQSGALALLRDLATQAQDAYAGPTGQTATNTAVSPSSSSSPSPAGVKWIESQSQQLATFCWYRV